MRKAGMLAALTLAAFTLCACSSPPPKIETVYVNVPIATKCIERIPATPDLEVPKLKGTDSLDKITDAYMIDRRLLINDRRKLVASMTGCVK